MRFGRTLRNSIYPKWKGQYMDYAKLKNMLREDAEEQTPWTSEDESKFTEEILNVQLEKVAAFQESTFRELESRANAAAKKLQDLAPEDGTKKGELTTGRFKEIEGELDDIINETKELKKYSEINYTAFLKIVKKHDRKRGSNYKIRPMLMMSLSKRPFNSESGYSPLLNKLSVMYYAVRQQLEDGDGPTEVESVDEQSSIVNGERYTAFKFWVHPDNLLEVKTFILRRLPVLVYSEQSSKQLEVQADPTLNSLYFDNPDFSLYNEKVDHQTNASSLRIRWYGQLNKQPELVLEHKIIHENGTSEEKKFPIKEKYVQQFIKGEYKMEKSVAKMERQGETKDKIEEFKNTVSEIQKFILEKDLQPVLRANYTRTAFQKPQDDKVRVSIDTSLAFVREDSIDAGRPCRNPDNWHRLDVDNGDMTYPFPNLSQGDVSRFPYALLEIKVKGDGNKKHPQWVTDLMASHLVHKTPKFSKFVHGVAVLFEDYVNALPFWLSDLETDIRKDPQAAFEAEEQRKAHKAENEQAFGSFLGTTPKRGPQSFQPAVSSPLSKSYLQDRMQDEERASRRSDFSGSKKSDQPQNGESSARGGYGTMAAIFPSFSTSRYAQARREQNVELPPGVTKPTLLIKDSGPLQVEPKVWLANERTFFKWMHISITLTVLGVGLNAAGTKSDDKKIAMWFGGVYVLISAFAAWWGLYMQRVRREMIVQRSGKDFDNWIGPLIVGFAFLIALGLNFGLKFRAARDRFEEAALNANNMVGLKTELL